MRILIVAATEFEIAPLSLVVRHACHERARPSTGSGRASQRADHERVPLTLSSSKGEPPSIDFLVSGVGMVAAAAHTSRALARTPFDLALNLGICGTFDPALPLGAVVHVVSDTMPELGAEDGDAFLTIDELGFGQREAPFTDGRLVNASPPANAALQRLPAVRGVTVNTVHGNERSIAETVRRFSPQVESMEGAGFMYAALLHGVPFAQVRAVSNRVELRDRASWKIDDAIANVNRVALEVIDTL
jgi:futalosine hydrolase